MLSTTQGNNGFPKVTVGTIGLTEELRPQKQAVKMTQMPIFFSDKTGTTNRINKVSC